MLLTRIPMCPAAAKASAIAVIARGIIVVFHLQKTAPPSTRPTVTVPAYRVKRSRKNQFDLHWQMRSHLTTNPWSGLPGPRNQSSVSGTPTSGFDRSAGLRIAPVPHKVTKPASVARFLNEKRAIYSGATAVVTGRQEHIDMDEKEQATAGFSVFNLSLGYHAGRLHAEGDVNNLMPREYSESQ